MTFGAGYATIDLVSSAELSPRGTPLTGAELLAVALRARVGFAHWSPVCDVRTAGRDQLAASALGALPESPRMVVTLLADGFSPARVAQVLGLEADAVSAHTASARQTLGTWLDEARPEARRLVCTAEVGPTGVPARDDPWVPEQRPSLPDLLGGLLAEVPPHLVAQGLDVSEPHLQQLRRGGPRASRAVRQRASVLSELVASLTAEACSDAAVAAFLNWRWTPGGATVLERLGQSLDPLRGGRDSLATTLRGEAAEYCSRLGIAAALPPEPGIAALLRDVFAAPAPGVTAPPVRVAASARPWAQGQDVPARAPGRVIAFPRRPAQP